MLDVGQRGMGQSGRDSMKRYVHDEFDLRDANL